MTSRTRPVAANDNVPPVTLPNHLRTASARNEAERLATKLLAANDNTPPKGRTPVHRGGRPAFSWATKHDQYGAACLWLIARQRLPDSVVAANDNEPQQGGLDTRRNGTARGKSKFKVALGQHLDLPPALPRLGDAQPQPVATCGYTRLDILPQNEIDELSDDFRSFGACADAVAPGADFIGAESGLGAPRPGKSKGSPLRAEEITFDEPPADINYVIELLMARENVSGIGEAFGARGRYQDKKGAAMLAKAMGWAKAQVAESNFPPMLQIA
ncbi:hypothetical protein HFO24_17035 [Rhizobium laguerreae]|uniref:hypothetical protein n=1 Tax=Rhizobium laguerreae TaxID=1076926 RepID=UPI001C91CDCE|nr:hypothetical protein [Rhizobium laguerreae]MBY3183359.1 hypothetical protein [Rhizobium laguerreae]